MKKSEHKLYWEDIAERVIYAELDDLAWKLPEKIFKYKKESSFYIYHDGKLAAFYSIKDSKKESKIGFDYYRQSKNCVKIIGLKKKALREVIRHIKTIDKFNLRKLPDQRLKKIVLESLDVFRDALSIHYLSQPQFFEKFEQNNVSCHKKSLEKISHARFKYTRTAWTEAFSLCKTVLREYGKRAGLSLEQTESLRYNEIKDNIINRNKLRSRNKAFVLVSKLHKIKIYSNSRIVGRYIQKYESYRNIKSVEGIIGNKGIKKGRAFVVKNERLDLNKLPKGMKKGMILIVQNAWPELSCYYSLASAIVTNEGGLTSHGVVVARELDIPCIVGTKIATKVFKTNDIVKVDAEKGVARIIKK